MGAPDTARISGRTIRTVEQTPRLAYERYWFDSGIRAPYTVEPRWGSLDVVGEFAVEGLRTGPLLLWDEELGDRGDLAALRERYFDGNIEAWEPPPPALERDATGLDPLDDDDFWPYIDLLGGRMWEKTLAAASVALAERDEVFILRWQETCALKQLALADTLDDIEQYGHDGFPLLGAVIGKGRAVYESMIPDWVPWDPRWVTDHSQSVPHLGSFALRRKLGRYVHVTTSFTPLHERLLAAATAQGEAAREAFESRPGKGRAEVEADLGSAPSLEETVNYLHDHGDELSKEGWAAVTEFHEPEHLRGMDRISMRAARALIDDGRRIRVRIVFGDVDRLPHEQVESAMRVSLEAFGGVICSSVEIDQMQYAGPADTDAFVVKRRFRGTREAYLERYIPA
ncbi:hypothetical protein MRBLWH10_000211 [Microbacterium sp. LWH10-1.2]